jgi:hypothetical protein
LQELTIESRCIGFLAKAVTPSARPRVKFVMIVGENVAIEHRRATSIKKRKSEHQARFPHFR